MKDEISPQKSIMIGSVAAMAEASVNHPLWAIKLRQQANLPFTLNPMLLYRGFIAQILSRIPTTALQMLASSHFQNKVFSKVESQSTRAILSGLAGGVVAATLHTPVELTMTYQQKGGKTFWYQMNHIIKSRGILGLGTGYVGTAVRLGTYTCGFFSIQPLLKEKLKKDYDIPDTPAHFASAGLAGTFTTLISNPADVVKTTQQAELPKQKLNMVDAAKLVYQRFGIMGLFNGTLSRSARVCSGIAIISGVNSFMKS